MRHEMAAGRCGEAVAAQHMLCKAACTPNAVGCLHMCIVIWGRSAWLANHMLSSVPATISKTRLTIRTTQDSFAMALSEAPSSLFHPYYSQPPSEVMPVWHCEHRAACCDTLVTPLLFPSIPGYRSMSSSQSTSPIKSHASSSSRSVF